jgi:MtN3 and saliva related transmembrane protein
MDNIEILGLVAATCTTSAFIPQVYKAWMNKSTKDISLIMYLVFLTGTILWFIYGVYYSSLAIMLANGITAFLALVMIFLKVKFP